jgi:hypothetical protein
LNIEKLIYKNIIDKMKSFLVILFISLGIVSGYAQEYNEEKTIAELEKYMANPKAYYDKIQALNNKVKEANKNSLLVAEEYMTQLNERDSIIDVYKKKMKKVGTGATMAQKPAGSVVNSANSLPTATVTTAVAAAPKSESSSAMLPANNAKLPYRVQLSSFQREILKNFLKEPKLMTFTSLNNRNVFEISGFNSADEAFQFAQELRIANVPGAFVTKYNNGEREEGYDYLDNNPKAIANYKSTRFKPTVGDKSNVKYPDSEPNGYYEIMGLPIPNKSATPVSSSKDASSMKPATIKAKSSESASSAAGTAPISSGKFVNAKSPTISKAAPSNIPASTAPKVAKKDKLDEAFEKMFGTVPQ